MMNVRRVPNRNLLQLQQQNVPIKNILTFGIKFWKYEQTVVLHLWVILDPSLQS